MTIGERINFFRKMRGMTQKYLGMLMGYPERSSDVRIAQYESGARTPKRQAVDELAEHLQVSPLALEVPNIDNDLSLMHTLFALEDLKGLTADLIDGKVVLRLVESPQVSPEYLQMYKLLKNWAEEAIKYRTGEVTKEEYDRWRYEYPEHANLWVKMPGGTDVRDFHKYRDPIE